MSSFSQVLVTATIAGLYMTSSSHMIALLRTIDLVLNKTKDFVLKSPEAEAETGIILVLTPFKCLNVQQ